MTTRRAVQSAMMLTFLGFFMSCSFVYAQKKTSKEKSSSSKTSSAKMSTTPTRPQYVITVTHGGRPLGNITLEIFNDLAPKHAANFDSLVAAKFYDGTAFHRVIPGFMIQGGDPNSRPTSGKPKMYWGMGEPGQTRVPAEFSQTLKHEPGILSAARTNDPNSATSQFFICHGAAPHLDGQYSIYGRVISGMEIVNMIAGVPCDADNPSSPTEKVEMSIVKK